MKWLGVLSILMFSLMARAESAKQLELRLGIEHDLRAKLEKQINTTLQPGTFQISVNAVVRQIEPKADSKPPQATKKSVPTDELAENLLGSPMGMIDVDKLVSSYEQRIEELQSKRVEQKSVEEVQYQLSGLNVQIGLNETYGDDYAKTFSEWVKSALKKDFPGIPADVGVQLIKREPTTENPKSIWDWVEKNQSLVSAMIIFLGAVMVVLLAKRISSKDLSEERQLRAKIEQDRKLNLPDAGTVQVGQNQKIEQDDRAVDEQQPDSVQDLAFIKQEILAVSLKIYKLVAESQMKLEDFAKFFLETEGATSMKVALLLDVIISQGPAASQSGSVQIIWDLKEQLIDFHKGNLKKAVDALRTIEDSAKLDLVTDLYWDILSYQSLGIASLNMPFSFVGSREVREIEEVLKQVPLETKTIALLHLPETKRVELLKKTDFDQRAQLVERALSMKEVKAIDIETISEKLKFDIKSKKGDGGTVSMSSMVPQLLGAMSAKEELQLIFSIRSRLSDNGFSLQRSYPTLAFLDRWAAGHLRDCLAKASSDEIFALLLVCPKFNEKILAACSARVQAIVKDDIEAGVSVPDEKIQESLDRLRLKVINYTNRQVNLESLFESEVLSDAA